jgi:hypothetical protein
LSIHTFAVDELRVVATLVVLAVCRPSVDEIMQRDDVRRIMFAAFYLLRMCAVYTNGSCVCKVDGAKDRNCGVFLASAGKLAARSKCIDCSASRLHSDSGIRLSCDRSLKMNDDLRTR